MIIYVIMLREKGRPEKATEFTMKNTTELLKSAAKMVG